VKRCAPTALNVLLQFDPHARSTPRSAAQSVEGLQQGDLSAIPDANPDQPCRFGFPSEIQEILILANFQIRASSVSARSNSVTCQDSTPRAVRNRASARGS
jgi:hypothetical protein